MAPSDGDRGRDLVGSDDRARGRGPPRLLPLPGLAHRAAGGRRVDVRRCPPDARGAGERPCRSCPPSCGSPLALVWLLLARRARAGGPHRRRADPALDRGGGGRGPRHPGRRRRAGPGRGAGVERPRRHRGRRGGGSPRSPARARLFLHYVAARAAGRAGRRIAVGYGPEAPLRLPARLGALDEARRGWNLLGSARAGAAWLADRAAAARADRHPRARWSRCPAPPLDVRALARRADASRAAAGRCAGRGAGRRCSARARAAGAPASAVALRSGARPRRCSASPFSRSPSRAPAGEATLVRAVPLVRRGGRFEPHHDGGRPAARSSRSARRPTRRPASSCGRCRRRPARTRLVIPPADPFAPCARVARVARRAADAAAERTPSARDDAAVCVLPFAAPFALEVRRLVPDTAGAGARDALGRRPARAARARLAALAGGRAAQPPHPRPPGRRAGRLAGSRLVARRHRRPGASSGPTASTCCATTRRSAGARCRTCPGRSVRAPRWPRPPRRAPSRAPARGGACCSRLAAWAAAFAARPLRPRPGPRGAAAIARSPARCSRSRSAPRRSAVPADPRACARPPPPRSPARRASTGPPSLACAWRRRRPRRRRWSPPPWPRGRAARAVAQAGPGLGHRAPVSRRARHRGAARPRPAPPPLRRGRRRRRRRAGRARARRRASPPPSSCPAWSFAPPVRRPRRQLRRPRPAPGRQLPPRATRRSPPSTPPWPSRSAPALCVWASAGRRRARRRARPRADRAPPSTCRSSWPDFWPRPRSWSARRRGRAAAWPWVVGRRGRRGVWLVREPLLDAVLASDSQAAHAHRAGQRSRLRAPAQPGPLPGRPHRLARDRAARRRPAPGPARATSAPSCIDPGVLLSVENDYLPLLVLRETGAGRTPGHGAAPGRRRGRPLAPGRRSLPPRRRAGRRRALAALVLGGLALYQPLAALGALPLTGLPWPGLGIDSPSDFVAPDRARSCWSRCWGARRTTPSSTSTTPTSGASGATPRAAPARAAPPPLLAVAAGLLVLTRAGDRRRLAPGASRPAPTARSPTPAGPPDCGGDALPAHICGPPTDDGTERFHAALRRRGWTRARPARRAAARVADGVRCEAAPPPVRARRRRAGRVPPCASRSACRRSSSSVAPADGRAALRGRAPPDETLRRLRLPTGAAVPRRAGPPGQPRDGRRRARRRRAGVGQRWSCACARTPPSSRCIRRRRSRPACSPPAGSTLGGGAVAARRRRRRAPRAAPTPGGAVLLLTRGEDGSWRRGGAAAGHAARPPGADRGGRRRQLVARRVAVPPALALAARPERTGGGRSDAGRRRRPRRRHRPPRLRRTAASCPSSAGSTATARARSLGLDGWVRVALDELTTCASRRSRAPADAQPRCGPLDPPPADPARGLRARRRRRRRVPGRASSRSWRSGSAT